MLQISHDTRAHRLSAELEGQMGLLDYELDGTVMHITHTRVPRPIGGRGVAAELMRSALELATAEWLDRGEARMRLCRCIYEKTSLGECRRAS